MLCYLDPSKWQSFRFYKDYNSLKENGINAVDIIHHNADLGVTLQQDLGDNDLLAILNGDNKLELIERIIRFIN